MTSSKKISAASKTRSSSSKDAFGKKVKGENFYRDAKSVNRLKMINGGKPVYDRDGKIVQAAAFQKTEAETQPGRVQPDKRWFGMFFSSCFRVSGKTLYIFNLFLGNTRVISQTALEHFRTSLTTRANDPYSVLLRRNKLPMALLDEAANPHTRKVHS